VLAGYRLGTSLLSDQMRPARSRKPTRRMSREAVTCRN